ncbi:Histone-lysine n-methyltransferase, partial [Operophtera brumata]
MAAQEGVKTPHRIELCEEKPGRPTRIYRKRSSKPLKTSNGITNMTNGHTLRSRAARAAARAAESHKLTEYFKEELKSPKIEAPPSPPPSPPSSPPPHIEKTVKVESKMTNGTNHTNHKLTEYFPVRRSVRKTSKCMMAEKMRDLERAVRDQREDGLQIKYFDGKGRGVIATRQFGRGQFVVEYAGELVGTAEAREREYMYAQDPEAGCYMYYFRHGDQQY